MSSMYKVIEVEGKGLRCIATTERIWPFIVNKYHYSLRFVRHLKKCVWDFEGWLFFSLILSRELLFCARAHTTSIWNFTIQWTSHDDLTEKSADIFHFKHQTKKLVKWQKFKTALCNLTKKRFRRISYLYKSTLVLKKKLSALQFNVPIQDGWMDGSPNKQDCYNGAFGAQTRSLNEENLMVTDDDCMTTDCCLTITSLGMTRQSVTIGANEHGERESVFFSMHFSMHFSML